MNVQEFNLLLGDLDRLWGGRGGHCESVPGKTGSLSVSSYSSHSMMAIIAIVPN